MSLVPSIIAQIWPWDSQLTDQILNYVLGYAISKKEQFLKSWLNF